MDALAVYSDLYHDYPGDADVMAVLGNLYRAAGRIGTAAGLYACVLNRTPDHYPAMLGLACLPDDGAREPEDSQPLEWDSLARLAEIFESDTCFATREAIRSAADVLDRVLSTNEAQQDGMAGEVIQLLPAFVDLTLRQARAAGNPEQAEALRTLQIHLGRQADHLR